MDLLINYKNAIKEQERKNERIYKQNVISLYDGIVKALDNKQSIVYFESICYPDSDIAKKYFKINLGCTRGYVVHLSKRGLRKLQRKINKIKGENKNGKD